jgi:formylglycine-generating enzyme required for sulfatase activity
MSEAPTPLAEQIAALEAALKLPLPEESRRQLLASLQALRSTATIAGDAVAGDKVAGDKIVEPQGTVDVSGTAHVAVAINLGRIIYGIDPTDVQREQLTRYLRRLAAKHQRLPLRGLAAHLDEGLGIPLAKVYVMLATTSTAIVAQGSPAQLDRFFDPPDGIRPQLKAAYDPRQVLPMQAIIRIVELPKTLYMTQPDRPTLPPSDEIALLDLSRSLLASEAVHNHQYLVLLGDPGGGKSTFLRHLAWALAQRGLDQLSHDTALFGWDNTARLLPILLPLRILAGRIAATGAEAATVSATLRDEMTREYDVRQPDELLDQALDRGAALLLFDGLDEVSLEEVPGVSADRLTTLRAVRAFAELHPRARVVITCRIRAFDAPLRACVGWPVETIAPFTLGQIRHFVADWYTTLIERGSIGRDLGETQQQTLIAAIVGNDRLDDMAGTPLLLTMMALVLSERGELPRDRPLLYERILEQLLGQWDQQRGGQSLTDALAAPNLHSDDLRPILDALSYQAHANLASLAGRGRLAAKELRYALAEFLEKVRVSGAWEAAGRCLAYFNERSGLLLPEDNGQSYAFAHLTLQEHGAGRHMLLQPNAVDLVMQCRVDDRWREPIALGLGVVQKLYPMLADRIDRVLTELIDPDERGKPKLRERWYRDLLLAAELGVERDWDLLRALINVDRLQRDLRRGLAALLDDSDQPLSAAERIRAAFLLGDLGDPRVPVTITDWRTELTRRTTHFGNLAGYWCYVRPSKYRVGGWEEGQPSTEVILPAFWIARFPITVAQYAPFVEQGYSSDAERWWTPNGWQWKGGRTESYAWNEVPYNGPNQPVIGITWYEATAFCAWLTEQLGAVLSTDYVVRLPTEAEWEAAAAYDAAMARHAYPWGDDEPTPERAIYNTRNLGHPAPVGCCAGGAAACGALDMAGNVREWTASSFVSFVGYPKQSARLVEDFVEGNLDVPLRGGSYYTDSTSVHCGAVYRNRPDLFRNNVGVRVVLVPRSH